jgi:hypothetical protein
VKDAIREGLRLATNPANAERNLGVIRKRAGADTVKEIALTFYD